MFISLYLLCALWKRILAIHKNRKIDIDLFRFRGLASSANPLLVNICAGCESAFRCICFSRVEWMMICY